MAIRLSHLGGPLEKDKARIKTASDPDFGTGSLLTVHGGGHPINPGYTNNKPKDPIGRPNGDTGSITDSGNTNTGNTGSMTGQGNTNTGNVESGKNNETEGGNSSSGGNTDASGTVTTENATNAALDFIAKLFGGYNTDLGNARNQYADRAWQMIESYYKENPLETNWGKGILDYYGVLGDNSANAVNAATAGENAGNIDSYAAANAERQRAAKLGQGIQSVMGMSSERFNNMIAGLNSIGVNTERIFGAQGGLVDTAANYAANLYNTDANTTLAFEQLKSALEGNPTYEISDDAVKAHLMDAYNSINVRNGNSDVKNWSTTDGEIWKEVLEALKDDGIYSQLSESYLNNLISQIMNQNGTAEMIDISSLSPVWQAIIKKQLTT